MRIFLPLIFGAVQVFGGQPDFSGDWRCPLPSPHDIKIGRNDASGAKYEFTGTPGQLKLTTGGETQVCVSIGTGKHATSNFDESKVGAYTLPDPLKLANGERVTSPEMWNRQRRPELIRIFEENMFGHVPPPPKDMKFAVQEGPALNGMAVRKEVTISFSGHENGPSLHLLVYLPARSAKPVPLFLGLNFMGNAATEDPSKDAAHWPYAMLIERGYGLATMWTGDMAPDNDKTLHSGVYALFSKPGQRERALDDWGAIAAWGWGLSRALDYFETDRAVDARRVAVIGHSRNGKAAVWAGARDTRFAMVVSNESGEGGAALSRRNFGETVRDLNTAFPHWFCENYRQFNDRASESPVESNLLLALIAPRPLYVASAQGDLWSDPMGEFLGAAGAGPVYRLLGAEPLAAASFPPVEHPILDSTVGYHMRTGRHDITDYDWEQYLRFADIHLLSK